MHRQCSDGSPVRDNHVWRHSKFANKGSAAFAASFLDPAFIHLDDWERALRAAGQSCVLRIGETDSADAPRWALLRSEQARLAERVS